MTHSIRKTAPLWMAMICLLGAASAQAQLTGFPGKVVCGFEPGNVPLLNDPDPFPHLYEKFKPGNYATSFNVLNLNPDMQPVIFVLTALNQGPFTVATINVNPYTSVEVGCDIFNGVPGAIGLRFEGMMVPVTGNSNFIVDVVYTFESQNAFERHVVYEEGLATWTLDRTLDEILDSFAPPSIFFRAEAASGAGGLGLGASIDVVRLDPVSIPPAMLDSATDESPPIGNGEPASGSDK